MKTALIFIFYCAISNYALSQVVEDVFDSSLVSQPENLIKSLNIVSSYPDSTSLIHDLFDFNSFQNGTITEEEFYGFYAVLKEMRSESIQFDDPRWKANLTCIVDFQDKYFQINRELKPQCFDELAFTSWRITGAYADFLTTDSLNIAVLSPISHNMDFMHIGAHFDIQPHNFGGLLSDEIGLDHLTALRVLFRIGLIRFHSVQNQYLDYEDLFGYGFRLGQRFEGTRFIGWGIIDLWSTR